MISIDHTRAEGTLLTGSARGDGVADIVKPLRWRWSRNLACWYVPGSRDRRVDSRLVTATADALAAAGHTVSTSIDDEARPTAEVEAAKAKRAEARADALASKADRHRAQADAAWDRDRAAHDALPPGGEPIKVGHHSEGRHRRAIDRAWQTLGNAVKAEATAEETARRARIAASATEARNNPVTVGNRIAKLEADVRKTQRQLGGELRYVHGKLQMKAPSESWKAELETRLAEQQERLGYWTAVRAVQVEAGETPGLSRETVNKGDLVKYRGSWYEVKRVNAKSVSISCFGPWTDTIAYHELSGHKPAEQGADA